MPVSVTEFINFVTVGPIGSNLRLPLYDGSETYQQPLAFNYNQLTATSEPFGKTTRYLRLAGDENFKYKVGLPGVAFGAQDGSNVMGGTTEIVGVIPGSVVIVKATRG